MKRPLCIYHKNCADGTLAYWVVKKHFGGEVEGFAAGYNTPPPLELAAGRHVIVVDFAYKVIPMKDLEAAAARLTIIDHHQSAIDRLHDGWVPSPTSTVILDSSRCGAWLTHQHYNVGGEPPAIIQYADDRDRWVWDLPDSKAMNAGFRSYNLQELLEEDLLDGLADQVAREPGAILGEGEAILRHIDDQVAWICKGAKRTVIAGYEVLCANASGYRSEVGHELAKGEVFGACFGYNPGTGGFKFELRSIIKEGERGLDVKNIAMRFGGGGHPQASGFYIPSWNMLAMPPVEMSE
jgi:hypothetical protein